jgi:hypothetical protein
MWFISVTLLTFHELMLLLNVEELMNKKDISVIAETFHVLISPYVDVALVAFEIHAEIAALSWDLVVGANVDILIIFNDK